MKKGESMDTPESLHTVAAASIALTGLGHTLGELTSKPAALPEDVQKVIESMRTTKVQFPGRQIPLFQMMTGFSLMMGVSLIVIGLLNYLMSAYAADSTHLVSVNLAFSAFSLLISLRYFFVFPVVLMAVATACNIAILCL